VKTPPPPTLLIARGTHSPPTRLLVLAGENPQKKLRHHRLGPLLRASAAAVGTRKKVSPSALWWLAVNFQSLRRSCRGAQYSHPHFWKESFRLLSRYRKPVGKRTLGAICGCRNPCMSVLLSGSSHYDLWCKDVANSEAFERVYFESSSIARIARTSPFSHFVIRE